MKYKNLMKVPRFYENSYFNLSWLDKSLLTSELEKPT